MAQATLVPPPPAANVEKPAAGEARPRAAVPPPAFRFESLVLTEPRSLVKGRGATLAISLAAHSILIAAVIIVPLFFYEELLPADDMALRAFFVAPVVAAPPPPPPPPPAAGARPIPRTPAAPRPEESQKFVAPVETPAEVQPEEGLTLGVEGGVPGGVEGGVPGGVVGGIVGGLPQESAPPVQQAVRVGGQLKAPKLMHPVPPVYPDIAKQARLTAIIILEATVGTNGRVEGVTVLRGHPLFDEAAVAAVKQWVYKPLLLNGVPTPFILTATVKLSLQGSSPASGAGS